MPTVTFISGDGFDVTEEVLSRNPLFIFGDQENITLDKRLSGASREEVEQFNLVDEFKNRQLFNVDLGNIEQVFRPTLTQRVEYDEKGKESQTTTVCGETENRREGSNLPEMTVEGIITEEKLSQLKTLQDKPSPTFISDIYKGRIYVKRVTIEQNADLLYWIENGTKELAFNFQLQFGEPEE
jgi:hypothetical protein